MQKKVLESLGAHLPPLFSLSAPLNKRIQTIEKTAQLLKGSNANSTRRKICGILKTASSVVIVSGAIVAVAIGGPTGGLAGGLGGLFSHMFLSSYYWDQSIKKIKEIEEELPSASQSCLATTCHEMEHWSDAIIAMIGPGTIIPTYEAFSQETRLAAVLKEQQEIVSSMLNEYAAQNNAHLPEAYQFYKEKFPSLLHDLNQKIENLETSRSQMEKFAERSAQGEEDLSQRVADFKQAKSELMEVMSVCQKFDA